MNGMGKEIMREIIMNEVNDKRPERSRSLRRRRRSSGVWGGFTASPTSSRGSGDSVRVFCRAEKLDRWTLLATSDSDGNRFKVTFIVTFKVT